MGHEFCGEVVAVGEGVGAPWREGARAAVLPVMSCGHCPWCRAG
jgi:(R,R)-butanediol dehydrogenase/meso-butanediol dehydrogenase/diacetyl reductase